MEPLDATAAAFPVAGLDFGAPAMGAGASYLRLRVESGSVDEQLIGLDRPLTVIGRRQGNDIVIHDTNVSRQHAQIKQEGGRLTIEDTNSSNGTVVNDERIEGQHELRAGDVIRIGDAVFLVEVAEADLGAPEGSTMALDLDPPMTSLGAAPELLPPSMVGGHPSPLTPPPAMMDPSHTALAESLPEVDEDPFEPVSPPPAAAQAAAPPPPSAPEPAPEPAPRPAPEPPPPSRPAPTPAPRASTPVSAPVRGQATESLEGLRKDLAGIGRELINFSSTLGSLADRVEQLEKALDVATNEIAPLADAIHGPDAEILDELQSIVAEIESSDDTTKLSAAIEVLQALSATPRDIELLLKLSQQAGAIETALRIHGRLVEAAPRLRATLARLAD